ncbi:GTP-binding protein LepA [Maribacter polysaccharolyticus]|uniref:GTP-binding protein LepA n=1 Tax=Maribacter polysaccharolyticus TaxID=3020831 RepID=UPI00237F2A0A|nr:GTP-binding protein LepA [Maribacter polysaccharolyticus]MDE3742159.1 GTP-binding protein LepA [Maribacter polysaccharolyticus]
MTLYIAQFTAKHRIIQVEENSVFLWRQESGEIDTAMLGDKIKRESSVHFFNMVAGNNYEIKLEDISVTVLKAEPFNG